MMNSFIVAFLLFSMQAEATRNKSSICSYISEDPPLSQMSHMISPMEFADLGTVVPIADVNNMSRVDLLLIKSTMVKHGVAVIRRQTLTRQQQVDFTSRLGRPVVMPPSFEGQDHEPGFPAIQRVTNFWGNGTWKGASHAIGCYWHKDGNFQHDGYIYSILYAEELSPKAAPTNFLDSCQVDLSKSTLSVLENTTFSVSVRNIPDFSRASEADFALYPRSKLHPGLQVHPGNGRQCVYITNTLVTDAQTHTRNELEEAWNEVISVTRKYDHDWMEGDIVIWDNLATMHRAGCENSGSLSAKPVLRMMYRTQATVLQTPDCGKGLK